MKGLADPSRKDTPRLHDELAALRDAIEAAPTARMLISSEEFFSAPPERIRNLADALPTDDVIIVAYVRSPDSYLLSLYAQMVRHPDNDFAMDLSTFIAKALAEGTQIDFLNAMTAWRDVFGADRILLRCYEEGDTVETLSAIVGVETSRLRRKARSNRSISRDAGEVVRAAKRMGLETDARWRVFRAATARFPATTHSGYHLDARTRNAILHSVRPQMDMLFASFDRPNPYRHQPDQILHDISRVTDAEPETIRYAQLVEEFLQAPNPASL
ncbi:MAG: hypothetical protein AAF919_15670 [Pseudomonadota bacterium]